MSYITKAHIQFVNLQFHFALGIVVSLSLASGLVAVSMMLPLAHSEQITSMNSATSHIGQVLTWAFAKTVD
jgi:hypothetical protein